MMKQKNNLELQAKQSFRRLSYVFFITLFVACSSNSKPSKLASSSIQNIELCRPFHVQWEIPSDSAASAIFKAAQTEITYYENGSMRQKTALEGRLTSVDGTWQLQQDTLVMTFENRLPQKHHISRASEAGGFFVTGGQYPFKLIPIKQD